MAFGGCDMIGPRGSLGCLHCPHGNGHVTALQKLDVTRDVKRHRQITRRNSAQMPYKARMLTRLDATINASAC